MSGIPPTTTAAVLVLAVLSGATTLVGTAVAVRMSLGPRHVALGLGFSAGMMVILGLLELIPDALRLGGAGAAAAGAVVGAGGLAAVRWVLQRHGVGGRSGTMEEAGLRSAYLVAVGLILHDLPEGFAMASAYVAAPSSGVTMALAIAVHNVPEEFAMALPAAALASRRLLYGAAVASAAAEPVGAVVGLAGAARWPGLQPVFLAVAAGAMIFVALAELVPLMDRIDAPGPAVLGVLISLGVYVVLSAIV
jgi:ZIP family zinc transporter